MVSVDYIRTLPIEHARLIILPVIHAIFCFFYDSTIDYSFVCGSNMSAPVSVSTGIKCWFCNSMLDPFCRDPFDNSTANPKDCELAEELSHLPNVPATMCRKIRMKGEPCVFNNRYKQPLLVECWLMFIDHTKQILVS